MSDTQLQRNLEEVFAMLDRVERGGEFDILEVQKINWTVEPEIDPPVQQIYRQLQMYASDEDIRSRDKDYEKSLKGALAQRRSELEARLAGHIEQKPMGWFSRLFRR
jgi:hypothetical protein